MKVEARPSRDDLRGSRMLTLRHLQGLTQAELGAQLGVTQGFISHLEKNIKPLPLEIARAAASIFDLPLEFFSVSPRLTDQGFATFRRSSRASLHEQNLVVASFGEAARLFQTVSEKSSYRTTDFDSIRDFDVETTATNVRHVLNLDAEEPLLNAIRAAERLGVGVVTDLVRLPPDSQDHSGISRPSPYVDRPLIATLGQQPGAVCRMTVMHELAHLIFDRDRHVAIKGTRSAEERRAFRFAGAMMLPAQVIRKRATESLTLHGYLPIKADYGMTVAAIILRAADLGVISTDRKRALFIQLSSNGWRREEPVPVADEQPILISQAAHRSISGDVQDIAVAIGISYEQAARWTGLPLRPAADVIDLQLRREANPRRSRGA